MDICPYYSGDYKKCNLTDTYPDESKRQSCCMKKDDYKRCGNYEGASFAHKMDKKLRPDPAL